MFEPGLYYLGGPMTGLPGYNYPRFIEVSTILRGLGITLFPAHEVDHGGPPGNRPYHEYLKGDLKVMLTCDHIILLEGWMESKGANLEVDVAKACEMGIWEYCDGHCDLVIHRVY